MNIGKGWWIGLFAVLGLSGQAQAGANLLAVRSEQAFPEAMLTLQTSIRAHGYTVARVQRVDVGLAGAGFTTDKYRIVFYGKAEEVKRLSRKYPDLIPYLPLSFSIFAEGGQTIIVAMNPAYLENAYPQPQLQIQFARWQSDVESIMADLRAASAEE